MTDIEIYGGWLLVGAAMAIAAIVGVLLPLGHRGGVLLALLAGIGVGIASLALHWSSLQTGSDDAFWRAFFRSSIAGFITVTVTLALAWHRARSDLHEHR